MKTHTLLYAALLFVFAAPLGAQEAPKAKPAPAAAKAKAAAPVPVSPATDAEVMEKMMKLASPGPHHERFKKMEGQWNLTVKWTMDPSQPMQETKSTAVIKTLMDGRYCQEQTTGEMMDKPFSGMGLTGYDNVLNKYVSIWIDNMGTGIMTSEGTADATGSVVNWSGESSDPMSGKMAKFRMVTRFLDDNKHVFEMYHQSPDGKEFKTMEITYERKM